MIAINNSLQLSYNSCYNADTMSNKYTPLWKYLQKNNQDTCELSFSEIQKVLDFKIDHSFLTYKKEAKLYGYEVDKISLKNEKVIFHKIPNSK